MSALANQVNISEDARQFLGVIGDLQDWDLGEIFYFLEKPWKWESEFQFWLSEGKPIDWEFHHEAEAFRNRLEEVAR